jgi:hypothetical protein
MKQIWGARPGVLKGVCVTAAMIFAINFAARHNQIRVRVVHRKRCQMRNRIPPPQTTTKSQITMLGKTLQDAGTYDLNSLVSGGFTVRRAQCQQANVIWAP